LVHEVEEVDSKKKQGGCSMKNVWRTSIAVLVLVVGLQAQRALDGYAPASAVTQDGSGAVSLRLGPGTVFCKGVVVTYAGATVSVTPGATTYIYLDTAAGCGPASKTSAFTASDIPIATVGATALSPARTVIASVADVRTMFVASPAGSLAGDNTWTGSNDFEGPNNFNVDMVGTANGFAQIEVDSPNNNGHSSFVSLQYNLHNDTVPVSIQSYGGMLIQELGGFGVQIGDATGAPVSLLSVVQLTPVPFTSLPASPVFGMVQAISDAPVATWGTAITAGSGTHKVLAWYNGTHWTAIGA
jgi:hypothetical protein